MQALDIGIELLLKAAYQPVVDVYDWSVLHFEVLARMRDDDTHRQHKRFIADSEQLGYCYLIDLFMVEHALKVLAEQPELRLSVNLSATTLTQAPNEYLAKIDEASAEVRSRLVVEFTETAPVQDYSQMDGFIEALRGRGMQICLDDYGVGFFTLVEIKRWQPDFVKLDGVILEELLYGRSRQYEAARRVTEAYGGSLIAEWVNDDAKVEAMRSNGIRYGQGDGIGEALEQPVYRAPETATP